MRGTVHKRIYKRKDGSTSVLWYGVVSTKGPDGRRRQVWGRGHQTRREALATLSRRVADIHAGGVIGPAVELGPYLSEQWLPSIVDRVGATTLVGYRRCIMRVVPRLGHLKLHEITPSHLNHLYLQLRESGGKHQDPRRGQESRPLSPSTVRAVHVVLGRALADAVDLGLLRDNPARKAKPPRVSLSTSTASWTAEELAHFLRAQVGDPLYPIWWLATSTGLRRGEVVGLRWQDIDLDAHTLVVRQARTLADRDIVTTAPKSGHARVINLDDEAVAGLRRLRARGVAPDGLLVRNPDGTPMHPNRLSQLFRKLSRRLGLPPIRFHDLRHTHASLLLRAGIPVKVVSERLGHADPGFTMRVYQHVLPGMQAAAAEAFAELVRNASPGRASESDELASDA